MLRKSKSTDDRPNIEATLERIVSNVAADNQFPLYKLVNYRRGGSLMEEYALSEDGKEVDKICKTQIANYMYNRGEGKLITTLECLNWRNRHIGEVSIAMSSTKNTQPNNNKEMDTITASSMYSSSTVAPYNAPEDHMACWILDKRGALGENPLHVLVICDTPTHTHVAKILLQHFPKLASDIMECSEYYGLSPLHLAVAYNNLELVKAFVRAGANVNERAVGRFFMPTDQQQKLQKRTNYKGLSYLGEYPLSWAACCENEAIYNYLLDNGADPNLPDYFGNVVLHMVVISNKLSMYGYAVKHPKKKANTELLNKAGLTPLALACTLGRNKIFREMLELSAVEFWRFCDVTCSAYPLIALDSISPDGGTNWKSALMIILNGETEEHLNMLDGGVVQRLLEDKWKTFARTEFLKKLAVLVLHLMVISLAVYLRPEFTEEIIDWQLDATTIIRYCAEVGTLVGCANSVILQQGSEIRAQGFVGFFTNLTQSPAKFVFLLSNICMLLCIPCRVLGLRLIEDSLLIFALPGSWFFLMFFAGAVRLTGPFVTMIYSMIAGDMVSFGIIYLIILLGFSQAFFFLFKTCYVGQQDQDDTNVDMYSTYYGTWMALYHMTLGSYQYGDFSKPKYASLTLAIFIIFMVMVPILLLNMLIAMMGNTYANVINKSEKEFVKQWAKIVLALERSVPKENAKEHLNTYAINLGPPPEPGGLQMKGVMAINCKPKTKAQQRKGAFINWRRVGKKIINEMRKYNCKGDQLLAKLVQVAASKKESSRGAFPRLLGEALEAELDASEIPQTDTDGKFHDTLSQLAFVYSLNLDPPQTTSTGKTLLNGTVTTTPSSNGSATPVPNDENDSHQTNQTAKISTPPPPYHNIQKLQHSSLSADSDIASVALLAVQASLDQIRIPGADVASDEAPESTETSVQQNPTNNTSEKSLIIQTKQNQCKTVIAQSPVSPGITQSEVPQCDMQAQSSADKVDTSLKAAAVPRIVPEAVSSSSSRVKPALKKHETPKQIDIITGSKTHMVPYVVAVRPKSTSHKSGKTELLLLPSNLEDIRIASAAVVSSTSGHRLVRHKSHRRKAGLSTKIRKFANKVDVMTPIQVLVDLKPSKDDGQAEPLDATGEETGINNEAFNDVDSQDSSHAGPQPSCSTAPVQAQVENQESQGGNPLTRWSTPDLHSMASLVAWDDGSDSSGETTK